MKELQLLRMLMFTTQLNDVLLSLVMCKISCLSVVSFSLMTNIFSKLFTRTILLKVLRTRFRTLIMMNHAVSVQDQTKL